MSMNSYRSVMPNWFRHPFFDETLKQVQGDLPSTV